MLTEASLGTEVSNAQSWAHPALCCHPWHSATVVSTVRRSSSHSPGAGTVTQPPTVNLPLTIQKSQARGKRKTQYGCSWCSQDFLRSSQDQTDFEKHPGSRKKIEFILRKKGTLHEDQLCLLPLLHHLLSQQGRKHKGFTRAEISVCKDTGNLKWLGCSSSGVVWIQAEDRTSAGSFSILIKIGELSKHPRISWVLGYMPAIPAPGGQRPEHGESVQEQPELQGRFEASLCYLVRPYLRKITPAVSEELHL